MHPTQCHLAILSYYGQQFHPFFLIPFIYAVPGNSGTDEKITRISPLRGSFVRTLIEFEGSNADELTFQSGSVIRVTGRAPVPASDRNHNDENGFRTSPDCADRLNPTAISTVDDGWWEGELIVPPDNATIQNQIHRVVRGVFPSMFVEPIPVGEYDVWERIWQCASSTSPACGKSK